MRHNGQMSWRSLRWVQREYLSATTLERFNLLTGRNSSSLQLGDHLLYMNPVGKLDPDGYYSYQAPHMIAGLPRYTRRMWTHGELKLHQPVPLNAVCRCHESIRYIKAMGNSCFVCIQREVRDDESLYVTELRTLKYTNDKHKHANGIDVGAMTHLSPRAELKLTDIDIVQYCQLTNNPHRIHWDADYARQEGYPDIIAPGPYLLQLLLRYCPSTSVKYKNLQPLCPGAGEQLRILADDRSLWLASTSGRPYATVSW